MVAQAVFEAVAPATEGVERVKALVAEVRAHPARRGELVPLLREESAIYRGRSTGETHRMRGWVLLAFADVGLPDDALSFVLEELESGHDAYAVGAAARALRGHPAPSPAFVPFVERALENVRGRDDMLSFEEYGDVGLPGRGTTATRELRATLAWLEAAAVAQATVTTASTAMPTGDCCAPLGRAPARAIPAPRVEAVGSLVLEDHAGRAAPFGEVFRGRPSIVAFFYTRCDNPRKCSLTIAKLARVQRLLAEAGLGGRVRTAAITYDPAYDSPARLRVYAEARGMRLDDDHRMLRAPGGVEPLREAFGLQVGFVGSLVNRHRTELFVLDARARPVFAFARLEWDEEAVVARARWLLAPPGRVAAALRAATSALAGVAIAFFPKCPMCWAAYLGVFGAAAVERVPYAPWLLPVLAGTLLVGLAAAWRRGRRRGSLAGFYLTAGGTFAILALGLGLGVPGAPIAGIVLNAAGALVGSRRSIGP